MYEFWNKIKQISVYFYGIYYTDLFITITIIFVHASVTSLHDPIMNKSAILQMMVGYVLNKYQDTVWINDDLVLGCHMTFLSSDEVTYMALTSHTLCRISEMYCLL